MATVTLAAVGDIALARVVEERIRTEGPRFPFEHAAPILADADIRFGSVESVLLPPDFPADAVRDNALAGGDFVWPALREAEFDVLNVAANHALDCGSRGLANTLRCVRESGAGVIGAGKDRDEAHAMAVVQRDGLRIGFIGYQEPCNGILEGGGGRIALFDIEQVCRRVEELAPSVDLLVVSLHGDLEFRDAPSLLRVEWCRRLVDAGATVVLCHHPHVPQGVERIGNALIAYSLGNFVFGIGEYQKNASPNVYRSHVLKIDLRSEGVVGWRREHLRIHESEGRPYLLEGDEAREAEAHCCDLDAIIADEERLREVWHESSRKYLNGWFGRVMKECKTGDEFLEKHAWRILCNSESGHWARGVEDIARQLYAKNAYGDFEHHRPNVPFE